MTSLHDLINKYYETSNPVTKSVYREIILNRFNYEYCK